jgi:two-component system sensor histidine kinase RegB
MVLAAAAAVVAGEQALDVTAPVLTAVTLLVFCAGSNVWLMTQVRRREGQAPTTAAGVLTCTDVIVLSWILSRSGGILNPASAFYLVEIVLVALVLGRTWTWVMTGLSVAGYATLLLAPPEELRVAQGMHPGIAEHMRGMWVAFAVTAVIIAVLVTRLVLAVERRDRALVAMREREARATRLAGLATLAAGAAHELSTPLSTIVVAARELERTLADRYPDADLREDARLIRSEADGCRRILDAMAAESGAPAGESPKALSVSQVIDVLRTRLADGDVGRLRTEGRSDESVVWPIEVVGRALGNLVQNALQASAPASDVRLRVTSLEDAICLEVVDSGRGMSPDELNRAGEPFYTTKPTGTGLGLFVARASIERLGGHVSLSSARGQGTTATLTLPRNVVATGPHAHG